MALYPSLDLGALSVEISLASGFCRKRAAPANACQGTSLSRDIVVPISNLSKGLVHTMPSGLMTHGMSCRS